MTTQDQTTTATPAVNNNENIPGIKGYRRLDENDVARMNRLKTLEAEILDVIESMNTPEQANQRSLALGKTNIQQGFMWAIRAVARPNGE